MKVYRWNLENKKIEITKPWNNNEDISYNGEDLIKIVKELYGKLYFTKQDTRHATIYPRRS